MNMQLGALPCDNSLISELLCVNISTEALQRRNLANRDRVVVEGEKGENTIDIANGKGYIQKKKQKKR